MSDTEKSVADRVTAQRMLEGTQLVPTNTCIHCGSRALVKDGQLEMSWRERGCTGSAVVPEITLCLDGCKQASVRRVQELGNFVWCYGAQEAIIVDGPSFFKQQLPQLVTKQQRQELEQFLAQAAT